MNDSKLIYDMELHEEVEVTTSLYILRVPGGWMYKQYHSSLSVDVGAYSLLSMTFVPYSEEFKTK